MIRVILSRHDSTWIVNFLDEMVFGSFQSLPIVSQFPFPKCSLSSFNSIYSFLYFSISEIPFSIQIRYLTPLSKSWHLNGDDLIDMIGDSRAQPTNKKLQAEHGFGTKKRLHEIEK